MKANGDALPRLIAFLGLLGAGLAALAMHEREVALMLLGSAAGVGTPIPSWTRKAEPPKS